MMEISLELIGFLAESCGIIFFLTKILHIKHPVAYPWISASWIILISVLNYLLLWHNPMNVIFSPILTLLLFLYSVLFLKSSIMQKLYTIFQLQIIMIMSKSFSVTLCTFYTKRSIQESLAANITTFLIFQLIGLLLFYLFMLILFQIKCKITFVFQSKDWIELFMLQLIITFQIMVLVFSNDLLTWIDKTLLSSFLAIFSSILSVLLIYRFILRMKHTQSKDKRMLLLDQQQQIFSQTTQQMQQLYEQTKRIKHDLKHDLIFILTMLQNNRLEDSKQFLKQKLDLLSISTHFIFTSNCILNTLCNFHFTRLKQMNVAIKIEIHHSLSYMKPNDLSCLLGNLFDNIVEYYQQHALHIEKIISFQILSHHGHVAIFIQNSIESSIIQQNPNLFTTKKEKNHHGMGLSSVRSTIEHYGGITNIYEENQYFCVQCVMPLPEEVDQNKPNDL